MLAQPADIFDELTWIAISAICFGAPLLGSIVSWVLKGNRYLKTRWKWIAGYYGIALALGALAAGLARITGQESALLFCSFYILMLLGPILGLVLFAIPAKWPRHPEGHCQICGYNLTGNVSGRCSECGTDVNHQVEQDELSRNRASQRALWLLWSTTIVLLVALPSVNQSSSSFLIGAWALATVILLPVTILLFLRRI